MPGQFQLLRSTAIVPIDSPEAAGGPDLMTTFEAAKYMRTARQTLAKWRCAKLGPCYYRINGRIRYRKEDIDDFVARGRVDDTVNAA
jgi:hypothetical protein